MARDLERLRDALSPTPIDRFVRFTRPDWTRTALARRVVAAALTVLALALALRDHPDGDRVEVVTAAHDLSPGGVLTEADLRLTALPSTAVPGGALRTLAEGVGHTLAGPARSGEALTDVRLVGSRLADATAGPDARIVPLRIDDAEVAGLLRAGDRVDIVAVDAEGAAAPRTVATGASVVLVSDAKEGTRSAHAPVVLAALPEPTATAVAAASLTGGLTVTLH